MLLVSDKPNILIIWGDDIGQSNLSCYSDGVMGYRTPNIDRIAAEGVLFTDYYAEQSCTAGRAAFITGQNPYRTGLTKVGMPGAELGLQGRGPHHRHRTQGTGLRHRPVRQEPPRRPRRAPAHHARLRRVLRQPVSPQRRRGTRARRLSEGPGVPEEVRAARRATATWANGDGTQRIEDTGPLTKKRMETCDEEFRDAAVDFIKRQHEADRRRSSSGSTPPTCTSARTQARERRPVRTLAVQYHDTMLDHDDIVGSLLDLLDELGIAENTIVMYSTDNGPHMNSWPDAGMTPFRNEKNSNWEGAYRVPAMVRWPAQHPGRLGAWNGIVSHNDWFVTLLAAAGVPDIADKLRKGTNLGGTKYKVHLDGHDQLPYLTGEADESPRQALLLRERRRRPHRAALRQLEDSSSWSSGVRHAADLGRALHRTARPKLFNLRTDPYERATRRRTPTTTG